MKVIAAFAAVLALVGGPFATPAQAQTRVFVAAIGSDSNSCTFAAPCRSFQHAHDTVAANGEIVALDPTGYGTLTINKGISINGQGFAQILVGSGGTGVAISTTNPTDAINLRGLIIDGQSVGTTGIQFNSGASLVVENCVIRRLTNDGINIYNSAGTVQLLVSNSLVADNGSYGIFVFPTGTGGATATFNRVEASNNFTGNFVLQGDQTTGSVSGTAFDSVAVGSKVGDGFLAYGPAKLNLFHSVASYNYTGVEAHGGIIRLDQSMVTGNTNGWIYDNTCGGCGGVQSYLNNSIDGNVTNESPPPTVAVK